MRTSCSQLTGFGSDHQLADFSAGMSTGGFFSRDEHRRSAVLADTRRFTEHHFVDHYDRKGNCALCYVCLPSKKGEKQVIWKCYACNVMLHFPECFKEWHKKKNPRSPVLPGKQCYHYPEKKSVTVPRFKPSPGEAQGHNAHKRRLKSWDYTLCCRKRVISSRKQVFQELLLRGLESSNRTSIVNLTTLPKIIASTNGFTTKDLETLCFNTQMLTSYCAAIAVRFWGSHY
eukprot:1500806-Rhodomonas_salina.1